MDNRFEKCNTLVDVYNVLEKHGIVSNCGNITTEEFSTLSKIYLNAYPDCTQVCFVDILKAADEAVQAAIDAAGDELLNLAKEAKIRHSMRGIFHRYTAAVKNATTIMLSCQGKTKEQVAGSLDDAVNEVNDATLALLEAIGNIIGCSGLKRELYGIMYNNLEGVRTEAGFLRMAENCRAAVGRYIKSLAIVDPEDKLGKVAALRTLYTYQGENGTTEVLKNADGEDVVVTQSIWTAFAKSLIWICKKAYKTAKAFFPSNTDDNTKKNIFHTIASGVGYVFGKVGNVIKFTAKACGTVLSYATSYIVAGVIGVVRIVIKPVIFVFNKIKSGIETLHTKVTQEQEAVINQ